MTYLTAFLLGLVQGVAEFLPISSSGHLAIAQNLLHIEGAGSVPEFFDVLLHLGTLIAVFAAYWKDICEMVVEFFRGIGDLAHRSTPSPVPPARRLILLIIVGTLPLFAVLPIKDKVLGLSNNMLFIGGALVVTAFQSACGLVNLITPTAAVVMGALALGHVPYDRWVKFSWKLLAGFLALTLLLLALGAVMGG